MSIFRAMFSIGESNAELTAQNVFDQSVPNNFWIVTSFIIPTKYKDTDWWIALFKNKKGDIVEGFKETVKQILIIMWKLY